MSPYVSGIFVFLLALTSAFIRPLESETSSFLDDDVFWITSPEIHTVDLAGDTGILYSRISFDSRGRNQYASLAIQASDEFVIWINGVQVAADFVPGRRLTARYDIKGLLRNGENHLAIKVVGHRRDQSPHVFEQNLFSLMRWDESGWLPGWTGR